MLASQYCKENHFKHLRVDPHLPEDLDQPLLGINDNDDNKLVISLMMMIMVMMRISQ